MTHTTGSRYLDPQENEHMTHTFQVRSTSTIPGPMTGATTEILMDGKPLEGVISATFSFSARGIATVILHMHADVALDADVEVAK